VFNCLTYLAYNSLYNLEVSERIFSAVRDIPAPGPAVSVAELARQVALALAAGHPQQEALLASLPHLLQANVLLPECYRQCCRSMTFWCGSGSGSADPCL
jgi:hypothetical protein